MEEFDLVVIGGGAGGLAAAKKGAAAGKKVALIDYVKPSPHGTTWGFGGTCVNVGCIPKKLMHYSATIGSTLHHDAKKYGWTGSHEFDWSQLVQTVQNYIRSLNFAYRAGLTNSGVKYFNGRAEFVDKHTVKVTMASKKAEEKMFSATHFVVATGGTPHVPADVPGAMELALTSDDIFSLKRAPGKTLVVGASYIALECAGLLNGLGYDVSVCVRSIVLRGFDRQCADKIKDILLCEGVKFIEGVLPSSLHKTDLGIEVKFSDDRPSQIFDTVLYATGRDGNSKHLGLDKAGILLGNKHKIEVNQEMQTNVPHIFAVGDIVVDSPELLTVALRSGELVGDNLYSGKPKKEIDYTNIPTTVFTPMEYGTCGLTEEQAIAKYGEEKLEIYLSEFTTLEFSATHREKDEATQTDEFDVDFPPSCLAKVICTLPDEKVIGFHFIGPNAGETTQGFGVAMKAGATMDHFRDTMGIHPTDAESLTLLSITKRSGESWVASGGCGGGKCG